MALISLNTLFRIKAGDYHATNELDPGDIPLMSCGDVDNGLVGFFNIPEDKIYRNLITVAFNGAPLLTKYHPYKFGAKDDVAVLIPKKPLKQEVLLYVAAVLREKMWRYSYGRKCFRNKMENLTIEIPVEKDSGVFVVEESIITDLLVGIPFLDTLKGLYNYGAPPRVRNLFPSK